MRIRIVPLMASVLVAKIAIADSFTTRNVEKYCRDMTMPSQGDTCGIAATVVQIDGEAASCITDGQILHIFKPRWGHQWAVEGVNRCDRKVNFKVEYHKDSGKWDGYADTMSPNGGWVRMGHFGFLKSASPLEYRVTATYSKW